MTDEMVEAAARAMYNAAVVAPHWDSLNNEDVRPIYRAWAQTALTAAFAAPVAPCERCAELEREAALQDAVETECISDITKLMVERKQLRERIKELEASHPDAAARDAARLDAADALYDCVESLFYAAPETQSMHYKRISKAMQAYAALRVSDGVGGDDAR